MIAGITKVCPLKNIVLLFLVGCLLPSTAGCGPFADPREAYVAEVEPYFDAWLDAGLSNDRQALEQIYESILTMEVDPRLAQTHDYLIRYFQIQFECAENEEIDCRDALEYLSKWTLALGPEFRPDGK